MNGNHLNLFFPQWQGSGISKGLYHSARDIRNTYLVDADCREVSICDNDHMVTEKGIFGYREVLQQLLRAREIVENSTPDTIFTLGGDCGVVPAPISYLNMRYKGDFVVVWFDAHGDLNTPETSPSSRFHGMPARHLLGEGEPTIVDACASHITPAQLIMVGLRDPDVPEVECIQKNRIRVFSADAIETQAVDVGSVIRALGYSNVHVHIDLDVLDPSEFPCVLVPEPKGLTIDGLYRSLDSIRRHCHVVGLSVTEYCNLDATHDHIDGVRHLFSVGMSLQ